MHQYRIPNTDLQVSRLALGTMHWGGEWNLEPVTGQAIDRGQALMEAALECGINHLDLADIYTFGKSDQVVGEVLKIRPDLRDAFIMQQKCGIVMAGDPAYGPPQRYDLSYEHIVSCVDESLERIRTQHLDLLALHRPDPLVEPAEVARAFDDLHRAGKVRWFGVSNHSAGQIELLRQHVDQPLVVNQLEVSLLHHHLISDGLLVNTGTDDQPATTGLLDYCRRHHVMIQAWSPLAGGRLSENPDLGGTVTALADQHGVSAEAIALAWLLRHPAGIQPVVGTRSVDRLRACAQADSVELSRREWFQLLEASRGQVVP
ncbi:MAG: aldo/keto reductase [Xanthomonadales bacterium]|nr:aldo/keto reductase [Xanthomonadales bacterium]